MKKFFVSLFLLASIPSFSATVNFVRTYTASSGFKVQGRFAHLFLAVNESTGEKITITLACESDSSQSSLIVNIGTQNEQRVSIDSGSCQNLRLAVEGSSKKSPVKIEVDSQFKTINVKL